MTATGSARSTGRIRSYGADRIVDYTATPLLQAVAGQRFDVVLNLVPTSPEETAALADLAADGGAFVSTTTPGPDDAGREVRTARDFARSDAAQRAEPFDLSQSTAEHRKSFEAFALRPYPADVAAADVALGGVGAIELTVAGNAADPTVLYFHGGGYVAGSARTGTHLAAELARRAGTHVFQLHFGALDEADEAIEEVARFFKRHLK